MRDRISVQGAIDTRERRWLAHLWDSVAVAVLLAEVKSHRVVCRPLWFDLLEIDYRAAERARRVPGLDET